MKTASLTRLHRYSGRTMVIDKDIITPSFRDICPAPLADEIWEIIRAKHKKDGKGSNEFLWWLELDRDYAFYSNEDFDDMEGLRLEYPLPDTLCLMLIYLIENKLINLVDKEQPASFNRDKDLTHNTPKD